MFHRMRLGRVSAPIPAGVPALDGHPIMGATPPATLLRDHVSLRPTLGGNDLCGDCTAVAVANAIHAQAVLSGYEAGITDAQCIGLYSAVSGFDPARPETDQGVTEVAMLSYQAQHGFQATTDGYVGLWANIPVDHLDLLRLVTARMGSAYLGLNLRVADQSSETWDTGRGDQSAWGAHAAVLWSYTGLADTDTVQIATWGTLQRATWRWVRSRLEEAHVLFHPQMIGPAGRNPAGLDRDRLAADVASFGVFA